MLRFLWIYYYGSNESTGKETGKKILNLSNLISTIGIHVVSHCLNATIGQKYMIGAFGFIQTTFAESPANSIYFFLENKICLNFFYFQLNVDREVLFIEASLWALRKICFHPAKFDNFKDEKISDFKTVSVSQRKNLLD